MINKINVYGEMLDKYVICKEESKELTGYASIDKPWQKFYSKDMLIAEVPDKTMYEYMISENYDNMDGIAIEYFGTEITFREFKKRIEKASKSFSKLGIKKGDVVTVMSVGNPELEISIYALNRLGAIVNLIDVRSDAKTIKNYINETNTKIFISLDNFLPQVDEAIKNTGVEKVITISPLNSVSIKGLYEGVKKELRTKKSNEEKLKKKEEKKRISDIKRKDKYISWNKFYNIINFDKVQYPEFTKDTTALYVHTGGTTGESKTVRLSNECFNAMALQYKLLDIGYNKNDTFLNDIVPFVAYGIVAIHMPMCLGITNIIAPILSPEEFTEYMIKYNPNHTLTVPSYVEHFINDERAKKLNWSNLKHIGIGGDELKKEKEIQINNFLEEHNSSARAEKGYGMTEVSSTGVLCLGGLNKVVSLGIPLPLNNYGIFKETDAGYEELKYGEEGEICLTGPSIMQGYLNNSDEEDLVIKKHNDTKWVHSGDLGIIDEDGFLYFKGRIKRMIAHGGFKVYPSLIEKTILKNVHIDNCCVIGIPSVEFGSSPEAHIVLKDKSISDLKKLKKELMDLCKEELPEYSLPTDFIIEEDLPLTTVGKVDYKKLERKRKLEIDGK